MKEEINWPEPWWHLDENVSVRAGIQKELQCEIGPKHPLWQLKPMAIAKNDANDDVIVLLNDGRFACVHLVWSGKIDQFPDKYPSSIVFDCVAGLQSYIDEESEHYT
ncbi:hypothetical protein [Vibrio sp. LaRot3]|uniref:hypothetical protein n=1 Tax=Vibrio sp. LaRot3 TaxID=2998829 RepID=UPI0022CDEEC2|nr:hypothetical protein [Vibrio sp. LaRot3]MDA0150266.1 hypothetical protein [Vibrio sp. LaRot3]